MDAGNVNLGHAGWHSRGYLPHLDEPGLVQMITFRLADSLDSSRLLELRGEFRNSARQYRNSVERELDAGHGSCWLQQPEIAALVEETLLMFDGQRYRLLCWVIMPNHVHVVVEVISGWPLSRIVKTWKAYSARMANRFLGRRGSFWQADYFDRFLRDAQHLEDAGRYIHFNPVKAGLCTHMRDWRWSSYRRIHEPAGV